MTSTCSCTLTGPRRPTTTGTAPSSATPGPEEPLGLSSLVLSGFLRVVTHPRVFRDPTPLETALDFVEAVRTAPNRVELAPGQRHWAIFSRLCTDADARGNLVPDAFLAAMAIEQGATWWSADRGFARYPGLRWRHLLG